MTALLALHIEAALDPMETDLVRSMARISISQVMLLLSQRREIPVLKRALPVFEEILRKKNLHLVPSNPSGQQPASSPHSGVVDLYTSSLEQCEDFPSLDVDFPGLDLLDEWQIGQMDFTGQY